MLLASSINHAQFVIHFIEDVQIFFDQTAYSITENQQVVTVILRLSDTYREDIVVDVAISELQSAYTRGLAVCIEREGIHE